ncbi:MAG TPA: helix-turn-helix domain-containing protein [Chloroflexota bacterium]|nr:helix-turn-helix domain-containing protein [Chloroflexota bacterium]
MCYTYLMVRNSPLSGHADEADVWPALELIADKWSLIVIAALLGHVRRYGELRRRIPGISQKMLTQTLRKLERDGLVRRVLYPVIPPKVEYSLTPLGETVAGPLTAMCRWAEEYYPAVRAARASRAGEEDTPEPKE